MTRRRDAKPRGFSRALACLLAASLLIPTSFVGFTQTPASAGQPDASSVQVGADADASVVSTGSEQDSEAESTSTTLAASTEGALDAAVAGADDAEVSAQADMTLADEGDYVEDGKVTTAADGATDSLRAYSTQNPTVFFYACIDGEWKLITNDGAVWTGDEASYKNDNGVNHGYVTRYIDPSWGGKSGRARYFMTARPLVQAYGALAGFDVSQIRGDYYWAPGADADKGYVLFANTTSDSKAKNTIWADTRPWYDKSGEVSTTYSDPGRWHIPLRCENNDGTNKNKDIYLYYLPNNKDGQDGCFNGSMSVSSESLKASNALCSVTVSDSGNLIYAQGEARPSASYAPINDPAIFTVKNPDLSASSDPVIWKARCEGQDDDLALVEVSRDEAAGTITYKTSASISGPVTVYAANPNVSEYAISYNAATTKSYISKIGSLSTDTIHLVPVDGNEDGYDDAEHHPDGLIDGAVSGKGSLSGIVHGNADGDYTVLAPDDDVVVFYHHTGGGASEKNRHYRMKFTGWRASPSGELLQPGDVISVRKLAQLAAYGSTVSFEAVWSLFDANGRVSSANFYVNCNSEVADVRDEGFRPAPASDFTNSIWTSRVEGTEGVSFDGNGDAILIASESSYSAYNVNRTIKNSMTEPIEPGVTMERFPSDEEILGKLRAWLRSSSGHTITTQAGDVIAESDLTTERFTVRWYSVKYQHADGWHVDGILVAKAGALAVSKTFEGDPDAIDAVLDDYSVAVTHEETTATSGDADGGTGTQTEAVEDYVLKCVPAGDGSLEGHPTWVGYSGYSGDIDSGGNPTGAGTYTWVLSARSGRTYSVQERGYVYDAPDSYALKWENSYWYLIQNADSESSGGSASASARWSTYTGEPVSVTAHSYAADVPTDAYQRVAFRNIYVRPGLLAVSKTDSATGNALQGVPFALSRVEGSGESQVESAVSLYRKPGTWEYSAQFASAEAAAADGYTEAVADSAVETGRNGLFFLDLPVVGQDGSAAIEYRLRETFPTGYHGADAIDFTLDASGKIKTIESQVSGARPTSGDGEWAWGIGTNALKVANESETYESLTAKKVWAAGSQARPVTVELWRNGARMSDIAAAAGSSDEAGVSFTQTLSEDNGWSCEWSGLPLFVDGQAAVYSLRETWIGDVSYSPEADESDGYAEFVVSYDAPSYGSQAGAESAATEKRGEPAWTDAAGETRFAKSALLTVNNAEVQGDIVFSKKDRVGNDGKPLAGAVFKLYSDEACTRELAEATSDAAGTVRFSGRAAGEYYLREVSAPTGYSFFDETYRVRITGGDVTITRLGDDQGKPVNSIVNKLGVALSVFKTNAAGREGLQGARFALYEQTGAASDTQAAAYKQIGTYTTDAEGWAVGSDGSRGVQIEEPGAYVLREIEAPAGYAISDAEGFSFAVATDAAGETTMRATGIAVDSPYTLVDTSKKDDSGKVENLSYRLTVIDEAIYSLPTAGGCGIVASWLVGVGLMCAACLMRRRRAHRGNHAG